MNTRGRWSAEQKQARADADAAHRNDHVASEMVRLLRPRTVPVTLAEWQWGRLASIADHRQSTVAEVLAGAVEQVIVSDPAQLQRRSREKNSRVLNDRKKESK